MDIILQTDSLPEPNSSTAVKERTVRWGGTGANIAKAAADLDVKTGLSSFVGDDFPERYERSLVDSGIDPEGLVKVKGENTPTCWIVTEPSGDQMALMDQGAMDKIGNKTVRNDCIKDSEIIHIGTGRPEYYRDVMKIASGLDKTIAFDPAQELKYVYGPNTFKDLLKMSDFFFCNEVEAELALKYLDIDEVKEVLEYTDHVVVTKGRKGSRIYTREGIEDIPSIEPEEIVDPTGAGDCYRAGFYAGKSRGYDIFDCCLIGSARASFALESHGPQEREVKWEMVLERLESSEHSIIH